MARDENKINMNGQADERQSNGCHTLLLWPILTLAILISLVSFASVFAKGGDQITRSATIVDTRTGKQLPNAMAVYSSSSGRGSVVVAGSTNSGVSDDYHVVKFNPYSSGIRWKPVTKYTAFTGTGGNDTATAVAVDSAKNIIVTGNTTGSNSDIHTIKYCGATGSPSCGGKLEGEVIWEHNYDVNNGNDYATAIAVDASDNIYVAGYGANGTRNDDFLVIKYAPGGPSPNPEWVELWDDSDYPNNHNRITAITPGVDGIAVTGYSSKNGSTDFDIITRKYGFDKLFVRQWRYSSPGARDDRGVAVKMDAAGNVIITGSITNAMNKTNIYTAKYDPSLVNPVWEKSFIGVGNDMPTGLWVDSGDVYITGSTFTLAGNNDIYTARFSSAGTKVWEAIYDSGIGANDIPVGIVVDSAADGGVFVAGTANNGINNDFLTLKYKKNSANNGVLLWSSIWNGPKDKDDIPIGIALEPGSGSTPRNVIVAGYTVIANGTDYDIAVIKYDSGALNAPTNLKAEADSVTATSIILTWDDNSATEEKFIIQRKLGEGDIPGWQDITTIPATLPANTTTYTDSGLLPNKYYYYRIRAYNSSSLDSGYSNEDRALTRTVSYVAPTWNFTYDGGVTPIASDDAATAITIDYTGDPVTIAGSPVVTGSSELWQSGTTYSDDYLTFKLDRSGTPPNTTMKWKARYNSGDGAADNAAGVALDSLGNVLVTGTTYSSVYSDDIYTRKVATANLADPAATPTLIWDHQYSVVGMDDMPDTATTIAMAKDGFNNSVVIGYGKNGANDRIYIIKYNSDGTRPAWSPLIYSNGSTRSFQATGVAFDSAVPSSNIYVTGYSFVTASPVGSHNWFTAKYNGSTGALIWEDNYDISNAVYGVNGDDRALSIDVDAAGNAYVTGTAKNSAGNTVIYTVKYNGAPAGAPIAERMWNGAGVAFNNDGYDARPVAVKVDPVDNAVVVGGTAYNSTDSDFHLIRYNPADGTTSVAKSFWHEDFNVPGKYDYATAMTMDASGYIYLTGNSRLGPDTDPSYDSSSDILSVIYDFEGTFYAGMRFPLTHDDRQDEAKAIAVNHRGEAFIAGFSRSANGDKDYTVLKQINSGLLVPGLFTATPEADFAKMDLAWVGHNSNDNFRIYRRQGSSGWVLVKETTDHSQSYTDSGLSAGTNYCYTVDSFNGDDNSRKTQVCATTTLPVPTWTATPLTVVSTNQITLAWNNVADNAGYKIEQKTGAGGVWAYLATTPTGQNSYNDPPVPPTGNLTPGTTYYYRISTNNVSGSSQASSEQNATTKPDAPTLNAPAEISNRQMTLTWNAVTGATSYLLQYRDTTTPGSWTDSCTTNPCYAVLPTQNVSYQFRVKATSSGGDSAWSNTPADVTAILNVPTWTADPNPINITNNSMTLSWADVRVTGDALTTYELQKNDTTAGGGWFPSGCAMPSLSLSCAVTGLTAGDVYNFRVRVVNDNGSSAWVNPVKADTPVLGVPGWAVAPNPSLITASQMTLGWSAVYGATGYTLEITPQGGSAYTVACPATTCNATGLAANKSHTFRVRTENGGASSAWRSTQPPTPGLTLLAAPSLDNVAATPGFTTKIDLSWSGATGATGYSIEEANCLNSATNPSSCDGTTDLNYSAWAVKTTVGAVTTATIAGLTAGTDYRYRITSTAGGNPSVVGNVKHGWTNITPPTLTVSAFSSSAIDLNWDQQPGETNYTAEVSVSGGAYSPIAAATGMTINTITYRHTGLVLATEYCYKVKAYSTVTNPPPPVYSAVQCKTTPPNEPALSTVQTTYESSFTVIEDATKNWTIADYWINQPVVITSGGNTYTRRIAGSVQTALYASPAFTTETINAGASYVILQTVTGTATGIDTNAPFTSLVDASKNWGGNNQWTDYKIKITSCINPANIGQVRVLNVNGGNSLYFTSDANLPSSIVAGDTYQVASHFGIAAVGGNATTLTNSAGTSWGASAWINANDGYYLMMTSGDNNGHARKITAYTSNTLTTNPFPSPIAAGDTYLIAPPARIGSYISKATTGSTASIVADPSVHANYWGGWPLNNWAGYYLVMTSGNNKDKIRKIASNTAVFPATATVSIPFDYNIDVNDTYLIASAAQIASYRGNAAGGPGTSKTDLVDAANSWGTNNWTGGGYYLIMTSGSNDGQVRTITGQTATTLTVSSPGFTGNIGALDSYIIAAITATKGSGTVTTPVAPGLPYNGTSKLTLTNGDAEFYSVAPGFANNYNYGLLVLKDPTLLATDFVTQLDYNVLSGLIPVEATLPYLYLQSTYASARIDFSSPALPISKNYQSYIYRGRMPLQDNGRAMAYTSGTKTLTDNRTMPDAITPWKNWTTDQWENYYIQIISGPNNQLVRKITGNTTNSITLDSEFPKDPSGVTGNAAASGNSNAKLVDRIGNKNWATNIWVNYFLYMDSGPNAGKYMRIASNDANSVTVEGTGFTSPIGDNNSYRISGDAYRINVIAGNAATNGYTNSHLNNSASVLIDSSDNSDSILPPKNWGTGPSQWAGFYLYMSSGPNIGLFSTIISNTANSITVDPPFPYQILSGDGYTILDPRPEAQAIDAYWTQIYDPIAGVHDFQVFQTNDVSGRFRFTKTGNSLMLYTSTTGGTWDLRRRLELLGANGFTPIRYWIYQLGRLPHAAGTSQQTKIYNFQLTTTPPTATNTNFSHFAPEVGHFYQRPDKAPVLSTSPMEISWNKLDSAINGYEVERCPSTDHQIPTVRTVGTCTTFTEAQPVDGTSRIINAAASTGLTDGYTYRFRVRAKYDATNFTAWNEQWYTVTPPAPVMTAPTVATAVTNQLTPTWTNVNGDNGYNLYWKVRSGGSCTDDNWNGPIVQAINSITYNHTGLTADTFYCYKIKAIGPSGPPLTPDSAYSNIVSQTTKPVAPALSVAQAQYESSYTVIEDSTKYWTTGDYWINQPVVITSGGVTYTKNIAGSVNNAFYASPAFTTPISAGDSYVILHTTMGTATGTGIDAGSPADSLYDGGKSWGGGREWQDSKIKILSSVNSANIGVERVLRGSWGQSVYALTTTPFPVQIVAGDTYRIASYFGTATGSGSSPTQLVDSANTWGTDWTQGYYLMMTSGSNNGQARKITAKTATILTIDAFLSPIADGDTYLLAPVARVGTFFNKASAGSSAAVLVDNDNWWGAAANYTGYYLTITSGNNAGKMRKISSNTTTTVTVSPAFENIILQNDTYVIAPTAQVTSYFGTAVGSPGDSKTDLVDASNTWLTDWTQGYFLMMTSGLNNGKSQPITGKVGSTITVASPFTNNILSTDTYLIGQSAATKGSGTITTAVAANPNLPYKGTAKLTLTNGEAEFSSVAPGFGNNYNYELLAMKGLPTLTGTGSWSKQVPITFSNFQQKFQTKITITKSNYPGMRDSYEDVRFYDETAKTEIPYWIESSNASSATIWIKTGTYTNVSMYYGNPTTASASNGAATFEFFDGFDGPALDAAWTTKTTVGTGTITFGSGVVTMNAPGYGQVVVSKSLAVGNLVEARIKVYSSATCPNRTRAMITGIAGDAGLFCDAAAPQAPQQVYFAAWTGTNVPLDAYFRLRQTYIGATNAWGLYNDTTGASIYNNTHPGIPDSIYFALGDGAGSTQKGKIDLDWLYVRKYAAVEPTATAGTSPSNIVMTGDFDAQFDYKILNGLIPPSVTLPYLYLQSTYATARFDFQAPTTINYRTYINRGRSPLQDTGRTTAFSATKDTIYDTRTMAGYTTPWKAWAVDQWKDFYLQITYGDNNQLVRKVVSNTANSITLDRPLPNLPNATLSVAGTAAVSGNSNTKLVDSVSTTWTANQWVNSYLYISGGPNAGQTRKIISSDASSVTVEGAGFASPIGSGNSYRIFPMHGDVYRFNVITGNAAINGSTVSGLNNTSSRLVDSSNNIGSVLPAKDWIANQWAAPVGFYLYMASGPNIGLFRTIVSNTANSITVSTPFPYQIGSGDGYTIYDPRPEAQAIEAYWIDLYEEVTWVTDQTFIPTSDTSGRLRFAKSGSSMMFYTAPTGGAWQLRRQLDLSPIEIFTPIRYWIYQLGRLPHTAGTSVQTKVYNFQMTPAAININLSNFTPEVGHTFQRPDQTSVLTATPLEISWNKIEAAINGYEIERCPSTDQQNPFARSVGACNTFTQAQPVDGTTRIIDATSIAGLTAGNTYRFRVRGKYNATDYTAWSDEQWYTVKPPAPVMTAPVAGTATTTQLTPTWTNVNGDNGYKLYWKVRSGASCTDDNWNGPIAQSINITTYSHAGLTAGTFYCYKIQAIGPSGPPITPDSDFSNIVSQSTKPDAPGVITFSEITSTSVKLSWPQVTGNNGYQIDRSLDNVTWTNDVGGGTVKDINTLTNSGLSTGTVYFYRVSAKSSGGFSAVSAVQSTLTAPAATTLTLAVLSSEQINLSWSPVLVGATNYRLERMEGVVGSTDEATSLAAGGSYGDGGITNIAAAYGQSYCGEAYPTAICQSLSVNVISYSDKGLKDNTTYYYRVFSINSGGDSPPSGTVSGTTLKMPRETLNAFALSGGFRISLEWTANACSSPPCTTPHHYELQRQVRDGIWVTIATITATDTKYCATAVGLCTFIDKFAINPGKQHRYRVRSSNAAGTDMSSYSDEAAVYAKSYSAVDNVCTE